MTDTTIIEKPTYRQRSPLYFAWRRFMANKAAVVSGCVLIVLIVAAVTAPLFSKVGPDQQAYLTQSLAFPSWTSGSASMISAATSSPASSTAPASH